MKKLLSLIAVLAPSTALAQTNTITDVNGVTAKLSGIGNTVIYLLVALGVIFIIWNVVMYMIKAGDEGARKSAGMHVLWGIVGLAIILSIWGLVNILTGTFRTTPTNQPIPTVQDTMPGAGVPVVQ